MPISVSVDLHYEAAHPCEHLLQIEATQSPSQRCINSSLTMAPDPGSRLVEAQDGIGTRRWIHETQVFKCHYTATFEIERVCVPLHDLSAARVSQTPPAVTPYLLPSRYCHPEVFFDFLNAQFGDLSGGILVSAISDWIARNFTYDIFASNAETTATDSFAARSGVCRDYAHVFIAMVRAAGIPARYLSAYAPDVDPPDFHAVAEVFLEGAWHLVDPTGMAQANDVIRIGVGRDAADVSFLTSFGNVTLLNTSVAVSRTPALKFSDD